MGLGTALVSHIESMPEYAGLRGILITRDAHDNTFFTENYIFNPVDSSTHNDYNLR